MRSIEIALDEYYHLYNRGMQKQIIFHDDNDRIRFLFLLLHFQSPLTFENIARDIANFRKTLATGHSVSCSSFYHNKVAQIDSQRTVELIAFTLMPNHFHLIIREIKEGGISAYMQRVLNAYTKYFNAKHTTSGHLFQGPFRLVHIADNDQLLYTSAYVHCNCRELKNWKNKELEYQWSSYQDYVKKCRWAKLLNPAPVMEQFDTAKEYKRWVETSGAKNEEFEEIRKIDRYGTPSVR